MIIRPISVLHTTVEATQTDGNIARRAATTLKIGSWRYTHFATDDGTGDCWWACLQLNLKTADSSRHMASGRLEWSTDWPLHRPNPSSVLSVFRLLRDQAREDLQALAMSAAGWRIAYRPDGTIDYGQTRGAW